MTYVDGFVTPVRSDQKEAYKVFTQKVWPVFKDHGALRLVECWGDDVPKGKQTDFYMAVKAEPDETTVLSWIVWPSKAVRDEGSKKMMADPRLPKGADMPFDAKRMIYGGFEVIFEG